MKVSRLLSLRSKLANRKSDIIIVLFFILTSPLLVPAAHWRGLALEPPNGEEGVPDTGAAGGGRNPATEMFSMLPDSEVYMTSSGHPTFLVYVPKTKSRKGFFSIQDENWQSYYYTTFEISGEGGIVAIALPEDLPELEKGKLYRWSFIIYEQTLGPDSDRVGGLIRREDIPLSIRNEISHTDLVVLYLRQGFTYDALDILWRNRYLPIVEAQ